MAPPPACLILIWLIFMNELINNISLENDFLTAIDQPLFVIDWLSLVRRAGQEAGPRGHASNHWSSA